MISVPRGYEFYPQPPDDAGIISWIHIGDLHMVQAEEQNHRDLVAIVDQVNRVFASSIAFVFLPGDVAEHGHAAEYSIVWETLEQLRAPWCSIIGDHDVQERSFVNYQCTLAAERYYWFRIGPISFFALNAFDIPDPGSFCLLAGQLDWLEDHLRGVGRNSAVLLLHCYPSDLKQGGERLRAMVESSAVRLIDMGHTHYNEVANDGRTLYTATRSTGQIEEGPVGFSLTSIDGDVTSWKFLLLGELPAVMITSPGDERFITEAGVNGHIASATVRIRAKAWGETAVRSATANFGNQTLRLLQIPGTQVWEGELDRGDLPDGIYPLTVTIEDSDNRTAVDSIRMVLGASAYHPPERAQRDQDNALPAWPERGLMGTQLGPNKTGRKW
jgi:3',5'-cyclic-AMP phosphodiesterase